MTRRPPGSGQEQQKQQEVGELTVESISCKRKLLGEAKTRSERQQEWENMLTGNGDTEKENFTTAGCNTVPVK